MPIALGTELVPLAERFWSKVEKSSGCWEWTAYRDRRGYGRITIRRKPTLAHRVSFELAHGAIPDRMQVLHRCDNPACVRPNHLFLGDHAANMADMVSKGRISRTHQARGERQGSARLTAVDVAAIRSKYGAGGVTMAQLAREFGVCDSNIHFIVHRRSWAHVP